MGKVRRTKLGPKLKHDDTYLVKVLGNEQLHTSASQPKSPKYKLEESFDNEVERETSVCDEDEEFSGESESETNFNDDQPPCDQDQDEEDNLPKGTTNGFLKDVKKKSSKTASKPQKPNLSKVMKAKSKNRKSAEARESFLNSKQNSQKLVRKKQLLLSTILDGLTTCDTRKGVSLPALKKYLLENSSTNDSWGKMRNRVKIALEKGFEENLIRRPKGSENKTGLSGNFKINKKNHEKSQKSTNVAPKFNDVKGSTKSVLRTLAQTKSKAVLPQKTKGAAKSVKADKKEPKTQKISNENSQSKGDKAPKKQTKHRRSFSNTEVATKKRPATKATLKKSKSLEQIAPRSKKSKTLK